jgi:hypothetical protein
MKNHNTDNLEGFFDDYKSDNMHDTNEAYEKRLKLSKLMKKLFKSVIQQNNTDSIPLKTVVEQKYIRDKIFDIVFEKFTAGERLQSYDVLKYDQ